MRRVKWIERLKVSLALFVAVALFLALLPLYTFPSWVKYGWNDIPVRGEFVFTDVSIWAIEPDTIDLDEFVNPWWRALFEFVTVIPDAFPEMKLLGYLDGCGPYASSRGCANLIHPEGSIHKGMHATIIFHPNPYIKAWNILRVIYLVFI